MLIRSLAAVLIVASSIIVAVGQAPEGKREDAEKAARAAGRMRTEKMRDVPMPGGINLVFLIKELAKDMDLNVLFDPESRLEGRTVRIDVKNVTTAEALNYILVQEGLISEEVGPRTILVAARSRATSIPQIGVGVTPLTQQLAQYFGVEGGLLINNVRPDSPGSKAGLKAGDVIVEIDGEPVRAGFARMRAIDDKNASDIALAIVRDRKNQTVSVRLNTASP